jgi:hypothetical protein
MILAQGYCLVARSAIAKEDVMRPKLMPVVAVVLLALAVLGFRLSAGAQDSSTEGHPLVGTWLADTDTNDPASGLSTFTFNADGTYIEADATGEVDLGAWEATGPTSATLTIVSYEGDDAGNDAGHAVIRASIDVGADGNSFTATYTLEFVLPDGTSTGEAGPGTASGTRLTVEAPGTPVMTLDELFSGFEEAPEATPAS